MREQNMFKQLQLTTLLFCISMSSYAYQVDTNFSIENNTDVLMLLTVEQPNGQPETGMEIPAHKTTTITLQNGDHTGLLYQRSSAPFRITQPKSAGKTFVNGRIVYYVGASLANKYSFLNAVTAADGISLTTIYSCHNGGYGKTFDNKIIINGQPDKQIKFKKFPKDFSCQGLKSSTFDEKTGYYTPVCFDNRSSLFYKKNDLEDGIRYMNGNNETYFLHSADSKVVLDYQLGHFYCGTWIDPDEEA